MKNAITSLMVTLSAGTLAQAGTQQATYGQVVNNSISLQEVQQAQENWGKGLIQIATEYEKNGFRKAKQTAEAILDSAYGYNLGAVLFKPTLASGEQTFRTTRDGALAYFVGGNKAFPQDSGFALKSWKTFDYRNAGVYLNGDMAITMGHVILTDKTGKVTKVDKTWGFKKDTNGKLRIVLHHSSLPYQPDNIAKAD